MKNKFEIIVSTMNLKNDKDFKDLIKRMNIKCSSLVVNQCPGEKKLLNIEKGNQRLLSFNEKGLSKSRNKCIENSIGDVLLIADDDMVYVDDVEKIVLNEHRNHSDCDIIAFRVLNSDNNISEGNVDYLHSFRIYSYMISFKKKSVLDKNIKFDERFGAGSSIFNHGEENIFLTDCMRKGLKVYFVDKVIGKNDCGESTWFKGFDELFFKTKGALYKRISKFPRILCLQFLIRKYNLYKKDNSFLQAWKYMMLGLKELKKLDEKC